MAGKAPGSLNLGMLDGSVRSVDKNITMAAWNSLMSGTAPVVDADDW